MDKRTLHTALSLITLAIGLILLLYMIVVESEPGGIPLLLIALGSGWYFYARRQTGAHQP